MDITETTSSQRNLERGGSLGHGSKITKSPPNSNRAEPLSGSEHVRTTLPNCPYPASWPIDYLLPEFKTRTNIQKYWSLRKSDKHMPTRTRTQASSHLLQPRTPKKRSGRLSPHLAMKFTQCLDPRIALAESFRSTLFLHCSLIASAHIQSVLRICVFLNCGYDKYT